MNAIKTTHNLDFEAMPWERDPSMIKFKVGTCHGVYSSGEFIFRIIAVINDKPGNGHLDDVFQWFENSCRRDNKALMMMEFFNDRFKKHCIEKRGFVEVPGKNDLIKTFL